MFTSKTHKGIYFTRKPFSSVKWAATHLPHHWSTGNRNERGVKSKKQMWLGKAAFLLYVKTSSVFISFVVFWQYFFWLSGKQQSDKHSSCSFCTPIQCKAQFLRAQLHIWTSKLQILSTTGIFEGQQNPFCLAWIMQRGFQQFQKT